MGIGDEKDSYKPGLCEKLLMFLSIVVLIITFPYRFWHYLKIVKEYQRAVVFRLGRVQKKTKGPGLIVVLPFVDDVRIVDLRLRSFEIAPQQILSKDSVSLSVSAVCYYRIY